MLLNKYVSTLETIPQDTSKLESFTLNYKSQKKKSLLLYGPPGSCKTSAVYALAKKHNFELVEINASDVRNADAIKDRVGSALKQMSLFSKSKIILVDEIDGISGTKDRGGVLALLKLIKDSSFPVICTCTDPFIKKLNSLRSKSLLIEFPAVPSDKLFNLLKNIAVKENISFDEVALKALARRSGGDVRGAIIDLDTIREITMDEVNTLYERRREESIKHALMKIFKSSDPKIALSALDSVSGNIDESLLWVEQNLPEEYKDPLALSRAFNILSKADVYRGRIRRWQYWRFLVYVNALITAGIAVSKDKRYPGMDYKRSSRLLKIWMAKQKYAKRSAIAEKLSFVIHDSTRSVIKNTFPFIHKIFQGNHPSQAVISADLKLDEEQIAWLKK